MKVLFFRLNVYSLFFYVEAKVCIDAHINICYPHQWKAWNDESPPVVEKHPEPSDDKENDDYVVTEAILAGKKKKEFPDRKWSGGFTFSYT